MTTKHPFFIECSKLTTDPYWIKIFENCAKGRFPRKSGYDVDNASIWFRDNKNVRWYRLTNDVNSDFEELQNHFKEFLKLKSKVDRTENRDQFNLLKKELEKSYTGDWKDIKKKNIQDGLVRQYILKSQKEYSLTEFETIELSKKIRQAFLFGWITSDNIEYSDREIQNITNLEIKDNSFIVNPKVMKIKRQYQKPKISMHSLWKKK